MCDCQQMKALKRSNAALRAALTRMRKELEKYRAEKLVKAIFGENEHADSN